MLANDLKKGDVVWLKNGWRATIMDNRRGNIRLATVEGFVTETGSIYAWDIARHDDGRPVEHKLSKSAAQAKAFMNAWR